MLWHINRGLTESSERVAKEQNGCQVARINETVYPRPM